MAGRERWEATTTIKTKKIIVEHTENNYANIIITLAIFLYIFLARARVLERARAKPKNLQMVLVRFFRSAASAAGMGTEARSTGEGTNGSSIGNR